MKTKPSKLASALSLVSATLLLSACASTSLTAQQQAALCPRPPVIPASVMVPRQPDFVERMEKLLYGSPQKPTPSSSSSELPKQSSGG
ncbi:hypothetical protein [Cupriavidus necator]